MEEKLKSWGGIILAIGLLLAINFLPLQNFIHNPNLLFYVNRTCFWIALLLLWIYSKWVEKQPFLLWKEQKYSIIEKFVFIILLFFITFVLLISANGILRYVGVFENKSSVLNYLIKVIQNDYLLIFYILITAGVVEELFFRGYILPRITLLTKNKWVGIISTSLLFGGLHYRYGTVFQVVGPFIIGFILAVFYDIKRSLKTAVIFHFLWDLMAIAILLIAMKMGLKIQ